MTSTYPHPEITLDQQVALRTAATRLSRDFDGSFGVEAIERFLHTSYDQFAARATVVNFLPLLAERFARQRQKALAKVARCSRASGTRNGCWTTRPARTSPPSARSATRSNAGSAPCWTSWRSPSPVSRSPGNSPRDPPGPSRPVAAADLGPARPVRGGTTLQPWLFRRDSKSRPPRGRGRAPARELARPP